MASAGGQVRLLLVHGSRLNAAAWGPLERELLGRVVCDHVDLPGHGEAAAERFTMDAARGVVSEAVRALRPERNKVVLAGHSLGGYVALTWAARHPGILHGLVLMGSTAQPSSRLAGIYRAVGSALRAGLEDERRAETLRGSDEAQMRRIIGEATTKEIMDRGPGLGAIPDAWDAVMEQVDLRLLADVDAPVLAINGEYDQFRVGESMAKRLRHDLQVVHIRGASHFAPVTHPVPVADALSDFVSTLA